MASNRRQFHKYKTNCLVESGTQLGYGIDDALSCGFKNIRSIEISPSYYATVKERFKNNPNVQLYHGNSVNMFYDLIADLNEPVTFWLDGHYSCGGDSGFDEKHVCPLLKELEQIKKHHIKTHTILVDDRRLLVPSSNGGMDGFFNITEKQVIDKLLEINADYKIIYEDGWCPNDIIVAYIDGSPR
jgi:hypothetical protein